MCRVNIKGSIVAKNGPKAVCIARFPAKLLPDGGIGKAYAEINYLAASCER